MPTTARLFVAVAALACLAACAPPPPPPVPVPVHVPLQTPAEMIASAKAVDDAFVAAFNKADAEAIAATYWNSPDAVSYQPDSMELKGFEAIKAGFAQSLPAMGGAQIAITSANYVPVGEDTVLANGNWTMSFPVPEGAAAPPSLAGRFSAVMRRKDGRWVYVMDHASVPLPPPPSAETAKP